MQKMMFRVLAAVLILFPAAAFAQEVKAGTYITDEEIKKVNSLPGVDRQIRVVDIGTEVFAVGIVHRGPTTGGAGGGGGAAGGAAPAAGAAGGAAAAPAEPCGEKVATPPADATPGGIFHESQSEGYIIVSGGGTLVTGGHIINGRKSAPDSAVTTVLNGPSCSGTIVGPGTVKKVVKTGDIIIIPAGVPHGWEGVTDHVDYLSLRPSGHVLQAGYVNPAIK
jgi:mannose-6-phosphate isomerase-like protein (cupin superfamily)